MAILYILLLLMVAEIEFPFSYVVDYPGLVLYILFVLGLLRMKAKTFILFVAIVFPISVAELNFADQELTRSARLLSSTSLHDALPGFARYYFYSTLIYLGSSMFVGYAICCQLERDARMAFRRELALANSNETLMDARRDVQSKTLALVAAKEELRRRPSARIWRNPSLSRRRRP